MDRRLPQSLAGASTARRLIQHSLASTTHTQYGSLFSAFADYCDGQGVSPLPADSWTVVAYVGHLADGGRWSADSLQPVFSAINRVHRDAGFEEPAKHNHFLTAARQGMGRVQAAVATRDSRVALPADAPIAVLDGAAEVARAALHAGMTTVDRQSVATLRESVAIVFGALFGGRGDTTVHLATADFGIDDAGRYMWFRLTEKGKKGRALRRILRLPIQQTATHGHESILPRVAALAQMYTDARTALCARHRTATPEWLFQLPGERRPTTTTMAGWLKRQLDHHSIRAPPGFAYLGHSIRALGASGMFAIGIQVPVIKWVCGWKPGSDVAERDYIDPTFLPSPACYMLYGWLLTRQYTVDAGTWERARVLPDPRAEEL